MHRALAWEIGAEGKPRRLVPGSVNLESMLEDWIDEDIEIIADDLLVIGRQVLTAYGTRIDLLAIDAQGSLVVIELKREKTHRETVAQGIEYAAWVSTLGSEDVLLLGEKRFGTEEKFEEAFAARFGEELPAAVNASQRIILVAPEISDATVRVIDYLAGTFGVPINAVSFDALKTDDTTILVRQAVRTEELETTRASGAKVRGKKSLAALKEIAQANGVLAIVERVMSLSDMLTLQDTSQSTILMQTRVDGRRWVAFSIHPANPVAPGAVLVNFSMLRLAEIFGASAQQMEAFASGLGALGPAERVLTAFSNEWRQFVIRTAEEADAFVASFRAAFGNPRVQS